LVKGLFYISVLVISDIPPNTTRIQEITVTEVGRIFIGFSNLPNVRAPAAAPHCRADRRRLQARVGADGRFLASAIS
jgi:hypothetical protein